MTEPNHTRGRADLQIHTEQSDGMDDALTILDAAHRRGVDIIAVTDHDQTRGAHLAREAAARANHPVDVIVGSEVTSRHGHILALWIDEPIPFFRSAAATVQAIWNQGGVAIIAHPCAVMPIALNLRDIDRLVRDLAPERAGDQPPVLAVETANPIPSARWRRNSVIDANRRWGLAITGGSDAHFHEQVGSSITTFEGRGQDALRAALIARTTDAQLGHYPRLRNIGARRLLHQQWRGISATPKALLRRRRSGD
ncbi:MAG: PHP domain-containing protein [Chloroflexota bacterium]|nr:PHP domain-containing protein [Chloroflexota bacterium]MDE2891533.1 PHP domain-containing protein [Chloroflexota bacterium]